MLNIVKNTLQKLRTDEEGASAVEYAILVGVIGSLLYVGVTTYTTQLSTLFTTVIAMVHFKAA